MTSEIRKYIDLVKQFQVKKTNIREQEDYRGEHIVSTKEQLNERDDIPKIMAANKIIRDIKQKVDNKEFSQILPKSQSFLNMNMVVLIYEYKGIKLEVNFTDLKNEKIDAGYGYLEDKKPMITVYNCLVEIKGSWVGNIAYRERALYHEVIHFLDDMIDKHKMGSYSVDTMDLINPEKSKIYYNSPEEINAITLQIFRAYMQDLGSYKKIPSDFKSVYNGVFASYRPQYGGKDPRLFYKQLTLKYQKKFLNRIYAFYLSLQEYKKKKEEQEAQKTQQITEETEDYRGDHTAPTAEDTPIYDVTNAYGEDMYSSLKKATHYYGPGYPFDIQSVALIQRLRNKPNAKVKIYRAVPDINYEIKKELKPLYDIVNYYNNWGFFPMRNNVVNDIRDKYPIEKYSHEKQQELVLNDIQQQIEELKTKLNKPLTINSGDWVTIHPIYAKNHGISHLNNKYKILSKIVLAKNLFTDGNDIHEWGYVEDNIKNEGVGDKYAERAFHIPDETKHQDVNVIANVGKKDNKDVIIKPTKSGNVFIIKNPTTIKDLPEEARGLIDKNGNLYVLSKSNFLHTGMIEILSSTGHIKPVVDWWSKLPTEFLTIQRIWGKNEFVIGESNLPLNSDFNQDGGKYKWPKIEDAREKYYTPFINAANKINPQYKFHPYLKKELRQQSSQKEKIYDVEEGVADRYAERTFHIPDETKHQDIRALSGIQKEKEKPFAIIGGRRPIPVYKNPKSLENFELGGRAIIDEDGNLYVEQSVSPYTHGTLGEEIGLVHQSLLIYKPNFILLHLRNKNTFVLSDSSGIYYKEKPEYRSEYNKIISRFKEKNPQYKIGDIYWR